MKGENHKEEPATQSKIAEQMIKVQRRSPQKLKKAILLGSTGKQAEFHAREEANYDWPGKNIVRTVHISFASNTVPLRFFPLKAMGFQFLF